MQIFWSRERKFCSEIELEFANLFATKRHWSVYKAEYFIILGVNPSACPSVKYHLGGLLLGAISGSFLCVFACFFFSFVYLLAVCNQLLHTETVSFLHMYAEIKIPQIIP